MVQKVFKTVIVHENAFNKVLVASYDGVKMLVSTRKFK